MEKRKVRMSICGVELTITTENTEEEALSAAAALEEYMKSLMTYNNRVSTTVASILTALRYYDEAQAVHKENADLRDQLKRCGESLEQASRELQHMQKQNGNLEEELRLTRLHLKPGTDTADAVSAQTKNFVTAKPSGRYIKKTLDDIVPEQQNFITFFEKDDK